MNHEALLALIADLYAQLGAASAEIERLRKEQNGPDSSQSAV